MSEFFQSSVFFGTILTFLAYGVGLFFKKKLKLAVFNPILIAIVIVIGVLLGFGVDYPTYSQGAKFISSMITPATICLAVPLYERLSVLKKNYKAIIAGILSGVVTSLLNVWLFALMFGFTHAEYVTFLIGMGLSEELGGYGAITAAVIIITGILGNMIAEFVCKICRITEPVAKGIAIGTSSHAMGTARAMEMGETEGAVSSLSIVVAGLLTVAGAGAFAQFI